MALTWMLLLPPLLDDVGWQDDEGTFNSEDDDEEDEDDEDVVAKELGLGAKLFANVYFLKFFVTLFALSWLMLLMWLWLIWWWLLLLYWVIFGPKTPADSLIRFNMVLDGSELFMW